MDAGVPCVFTSYNAEEAAGDAAAWRELGGAVVQEPRENPYRRACVREHSLHNPY